MLRSLVLIAVLISLDNSAPVREPERHRVVIVGSGVSGFAAAVTLLEHNVTDLVVLEASDRIGGRIKTVQFGGVPLDVGAEFIHGEKDNAVFELASPYNLLASYQPLMNSDKILFPTTSGHVYNSSYVKELIELAYQIPEENDFQHFNGSAAGYFFPRLNEILQSKNVEPELREALHHFVPVLITANSAAEDLTQQGAWGSSQSIENEGDNVLKWKTGGYNNIFDILSKKFPDSAQELPVVSKITFDKQVTRVEQTDGGVEVVCADGSKYVAEHVIVTVSLGVLKKHAAAMFHPPLPEDKSTAIETIGFGCLSKVFLLFPTRWWPSHTNLILPLFSKQELQDFQNNSVHGYWTSYNMGFYPVMNSNRMLCAWFSGKSCRTMESLNETQVVDGLMEILHKVFEKDVEIPKPEGILRSGWASYPHTLGAYSYRSVASDALNMTNDHLAQPVTAGDKPVILFAGEATHPHYFGTVHGALSTGRREAQNLINYIKKP